MKAAFTSYIKVVERAKVFLNDFVIRIIYLAQKLWISGDSVKFEQINVC